MSRVGDSRSGLFGKALIVGKPPEQHAGVEEDLHALLLFGASFEEVRDEVIIRIEVICDFDFALHATRVTGRFRCDIRAQHRDGRARLTNNDRLTAHNPSKDSGKMSFGLVYVDRFHGIKITSGLDLVN